MQLIKPFGTITEYNEQDYNKSFAPYVSIENLFSLEEVSRIKSLWNDEAGKDGKLENNNLNYEVRKSKVMFIEPGESDWIYNKLQMAILMTNANRYKFDITGFQTKLQLTSYSIGEFYHWHMDSGGGANSLRKLSITVQLTNENEYEGGELQFIKGNTFVSATKAIGTAVIFPSYMLHRVEPVTKGRRQSIVGWIAGLPYR